MCANEIEGAEKLVSDGVGELGVASENGNVKFTVTPKMEKDQKPDSFFFRVKMK